MSMDVSSPQHPSRLLGLHFGIRRRSPSNPPPPRSDAEPLIQHDQSTPFRAFARRANTQQDPQPANRTAPPASPPPSSPGRTSGLSSIMLRRSGRRDSTAAPIPSPVAVSSIPPTELSHQQSSLAPQHDPPLPSRPLPGPVHRIRLVPHVESSRSLPFEPIIRDAVENGPVLRVGRFTDRQNAASSAPTAPNAPRIAFRSKVVSRGHADIWVEAGGKFFIKDTKSSSGTFLNHVRLANANVESRPFPIKDGDIIQLGIDYQGGQQEIYRCVKFKVEIGREWQTAANAFNTNALRRLNGLGVTNVAPSTVIAGPNAPSASAASAISAAQSSGPAPTTDCCICLFPVTVCQALFIAPCSHAFHYKCMRPMLVAHHPGFSCPLCRTFADLDSDVEVDLPAQYQLPSLSGSNERRLETATEEVGEAAVSEGEAQAIVGDLSLANHDGDSQPYGDDEVEAMVTSENERADHEDHEEDDDDDIPEENDDADEAEVHAHVSSPNSLGLLNPHNSIHAVGSSSSRNSSRANSGLSSAENHAIDLDSDFEDDAEREDGTDMDVEVDPGYGGPSTRSRFAVASDAAGRLTSIGSKRKRQAHP